MQRKSANSFLKQQLDKSSVQVFYLSLYASLPIFIVHLCRNRLTMHHCGHLFVSQPPCVRCTLHSLLSNSSGSNRKDRCVRFRLPCLLFKYEPLRALENRLDIGIKESLVNMGCCHAGRRKRVCVCGKWVEAAY